MDPDDLLIDARALAALLDQPDLRIADVRWVLGHPGAGHEQYAAGHVPGAIFLDIDQELCAPTGPGRHPLPDPAELARVLGARGIGDEHLVVVYDDGGGTIAARLWWMLDHLGHHRVRLLDGGLRAWVEAGLPLSLEVSSWPPTTLRLGDRWSGTIDREALVERLGSVTLLDVRAPERYRGEVEPIDPVAGHIPTARSAPTLANLDPQGRFAAPAALRQRFEELRATPTASEPSDRPVVTYCGSGVNSCHTVLAMRLAGLPEPLLYPGSYSDWSRSGMPVLTGPEPGTWPPPRLPEAS